MTRKGIDTEKIRKALQGKVAVAGDPGELDPAVGPHGGTHDTDVEIADDVVKLVDVNSPKTPDLETRAYEGGCEEDGSADTPPYDGKSSVDGIPTIPETMAAAKDNAGDKQKNKGGGGPVVQLPETLEDELSVAPKDPHASVSFTTHDLDDLRCIMSEKADENVEKAVKALQWLDRNSKNPRRAEVQAKLDQWKATKEQALEAQARYAFAFLHTEAAAANKDQTLAILAWLKNYLIARKRQIAAKFLAGAEAKSNPALTAKINAWLKVTATDQVTENKEDVGIEDITLYGPQNGSPDHRPNGDGGFTEPKVVSLKDVPFKNPDRHPAEAGSETDKQTGSPSQDSNAVDSGSFSAKGDDRAKESNLPTAKTQKKVAANPMPFGNELAAPPVPGMPGMPGMEEEMPPMPGQEALPELPPALPEGDGGPAAGAPMPGGMPGMPPAPAAPPAAPMTPAAPMGEGAPPMGMDPMNPMGGGDGMDMDLERWLQQEMQEPSHEEPAQSAHVEMLSSFDDLPSQVVAEDVVMSLYGEDQENPHWNIDILGRPVARVELKDQPNPEQVRSTFLSGSYAENVAQAIAKVGAAEVLTSINAKSYAASIEVGDLANKIKARVEAEMEAKFAAKVGELRERFLTAAKIALAGYNNNFFRGQDHALKGAIWGELTRLGVHNAAPAIEAAFSEGSVPFFDAVLAKAEELMDMPDEARNAIANAIPETNSLVTADAGTGDELPSYETLARRLEAGNVPFESGSSVTATTRTGLRDQLRSRARLSTVRTS